MHSWALSLRKPTSQIRVLAANKSLYSCSLFTKSNTSFLGSSSRKGERRYHKNESDKSDWTFLESLLRSVSYGVVGSSLLGLSYSSSFCGSDSFVSFADYSGNQRREPDKKPNFLFKDTYRRKVFFKYEKRIRTRSPPEKVN
ncbi:hypothetical protein DH2020_010807 [Rehmannia glutinosa]|uniref:Uncharacterized protein n=1 Tax=Rehmannia glutinosa TaxID=99300 RepID=A0ABR0XBM7_REHGL